jgi:hypothetical protein
MNKRLPVSEANGHQFVNNEAEVHVFNGEMFPAGFPLGGCRICGQHPTYEVIEGAAHVQEPCSHPDGITTTITLSVPSGKLLVSDNLRPVYNTPGTYQFVHSGERGFDVDSEETVIFAHVDRIA